jgi:WhiB family redox-sensing transcriptional regulator
MTAAEEPEWHELALCREVGGDLFFAESGDLSHVKEAKQVCAACTVRTSCLEDALRISTFHDRYGIRAGMSPGQRARLRATRTKGMAA